MPVQQPPVRNSSVIAAGVYSHRGEFVTSVTDLVFPARGLGFVFTRTYRAALATELGLLGYGGDLTMHKSLFMSTTDL
jgi:hypothetical protein